MDDVCDECVHIGSICGPTRAESGNDVAIGGVAPTFEDISSRERLDLRLGQDRELLVGGRWRKEIDRPCFKGLTDTHGHAYSVPTDIEIQSLRKQCLELNTKQAPLSQQSAALLDEVTKVTLK